VPAGIVPVGAGDDDPQAVEAVAGGWGARCNVGAARAARRPVEI